MKKINSSVNQKDRIICVALPGELEFYYQAFGSRERIELFKGEDDKAITFSGSVFAYFRDKGIGHDKRSGYSLTIRELYSADKGHYRNPKLSKLFYRLADAIDTALGENVKQKEQVKLHQKPTKKNDKVYYGDRELAA